MIVGHGADWLLEVIRKVIVKHFQKVDFMIGLHDKGIPAAKKRKKKLPNNHNLFPGFLFCLGVLRPSANMWLTPVVIVFSLFFSSYWCIPPHSCHDPDVGGMFKRQKEFLHVCYIPMTNIIPRSSFPINL